MVAQKILITGVRLYCKKLFYIKEKTISQDGLFFCSTWNYLDLSGICSTWNVLSPEFN